MPMGGIIHKKFGILFNTWNLLEFLCVKKDLGVVGWKDEPMGCNAI